MKKKVLICILFLVMSFLNLSNVEAKKYTNYDTGTCIDDFGTITYKNNGTGNFGGGRVFFSNKKNNLDWNTDPVSFDVEVMARINYNLTDVHYSIESKDGYSCSGVIKGDIFNNNQGSVVFSVVINKGWVNDMAFWGKSVSRSDSKKSDSTKSNKINVNRKMTDAELKEINEELKLDTGEAVGCDTISDLFDKYWTWVMILAPVAVILLITIDFVSPILAGDSADALKKASDRALKRAIALVILLMLPVILNLLFGLFGIEFCF